MTFEQAFQIEPEECVPDSRLPQAELFHQLLFIDARTGFDLAGNDGHEKPSYASVLRSFPAFAGFCLRGIRSSLASALLAQLLLDAFRLFVSRMPVHVCQRLHGQ